MPEHLIDAVFNKGTWQDQAAFINGANAAFESLLLDIGVKGTLEAMSKYGYADAAHQYHYIVVALHAEANARKIQRGL